MAIEKNSVGKIGVISKKPDVMDYTVGVEFYTKPMNSKEKVLAF